MESHTQLSQELGMLLLQKSQVLTTAESCTGGGIATAVTDIAGSSAWFDRAFITYSNQAKVDMVGVKESTLEQVGAVSEKVVIEMAQGALLHSNATISVAVSGIAGPSGGSEEKPVGTVCFAWADNQGWLKVETYCFPGDRAQVRAQTVRHALQQLSQHLSSSS
ncbi:nicotinamide-nucleotide amidase [Vibrio sp. SCSIO 43135]|uniref:Nicotinamide-nucleotide amidase n=1 Tax=Vibrio paucivorans TaxID=2829489 RepID=A0A9X3CDP6_9VIBR|nr:MULTISPECIES: nicotinamide-nucleotide amidase [Vibrio]MCW8333735.1 nicotinamide-nucleotide amidase [Vibrio paucivorans]USD41570.1 nicotinamide-nucleotide amidase [Vibrio sp. SCSIO 43135]